MEQLGRLQGVDARQARLFAAADGRRLRLPSDGGGLEAAA
ncbi:hypothetical protein SAMN07250955_101202 [Arboricoccus pini]|uniref:Uncharacterized protein n=1 Tax=Arboricoccus pini TaxID=1963835 RepID=A0A212PYX7_9PROT|nr:hypothetical protein SAMN07250955_101202 [Arboricoccus pini]